MKTTTSNAWQGVSSAGVGMAWLAEGSAAADSGSAVGQIQIIPQKAASWVTGSFEVMQDTDYADQLPGLLADGKDVWEEAAFALGTGGTTGPERRAAARHRRWRSAPRRRSPPPRSAPPAGRSSAPQASPTCTT